MIPFLLGLLLLAGFLGAAFWFANQKTEKATRMVRLILGSGSAVRSRLLRDAGLTIEVIPADVDEAAIRQALRIERVDALCELRVACHVGRGDWPVSLRQLHDAASGWEWRWRRGALLDEFIARVLELLLLLLIAPFVIHLLSDGRLVAIRKG